MTNATDSGPVQAYLDLDGVHTYYEAVGDGPPLALLHGGMCPIETWGGLIPQLTSSFRVYAPERRGHGRTADVDGPITYDLMATDTIAFLEAMALGTVDLVGWSDGGIIGVLVALWRPDLVKRLVMVGAQVNLDGLPPELRATLEGGLDASMLPPALRELYAAVSPDPPEHFDVVFQKLTADWKVAPNLELSELTALRAPTLVVGADHDMPTTEHLAAVARSIPDAQLAIVPGTDHGFPMEQPDLLAGLLLRFLA